MEANPRAQETKSTNPTLEALAWQMEQIVRSDKTSSPSGFDWDDEPAAPEPSSSEHYVKPTVSENDVKPEVSPPIEPAAPIIGERFASLGQRFAFGKVYAWGLIALIGVGAYVF